MEGHERFLHFHIASLGPAFSPGARRFLALTIDNGMDDERYCSLEREIVRVSSARRLSDFTISAYRTMKLTRSRKSGCSSALAEQSRARRCKVTSMRSKRCTLLRGVIGTFMVILRVYGFSW